MTDACAGMQQYLISRGVQYDGEPEVDITAEDGNGQEINGNAMTY